MEPADKVARCRYLLLLWPLWHVGITQADAASNSTPHWVPVAETGAGRIYHRDVEASPVPMVMIGAKLEAAPARVHTVVTDYDRFAEFIPHVLESRVLAREGNHQWVFQHLHFAGPVADRAYVLRSSEVKSAAESGYRVEWRLAGRRFPAADLQAGVRPRRLSGFWELRPSAEGAATEARYALHSDPGGLIPAWLVTRMTDRYVEQVIEAVRERLLDSTTPLVEYP